MHFRSEWAFARTRPIRRRSESLRSHSHHCCLVFIFLVFTSVRIVTVCRVHLVRAIIILVSSRTDPAVRQSVLVVARFSLAVDCRRLGGRAAFEVAKCDDHCESAFAAQSSAAPICIAHGVSHAWQWRQWRWWSGGICWKSFSKVTGEYFGTTTTTTTTTTITETLI